MSRPPLYLEGKDETNKTIQKKKTKRFSCHLLKGTSFLFEVVPDEVFNQKMLGDGLQLFHYVIAPVDCKVEKKVFETKHAIL
jgi:phosphotransferase system IIA component